MKTFLAPLPGSGIWLSLILLLALSSRAGGQTVAYDNGAPNQVNGSEMTSFIEADEFAVANLATIGSVRFWDFEMATAFAGSMYWSLNTNNAGLPGTQLFGGVATTVSRYATGLSVSGFPEYSNSFSIPIATLPAGTYWLELHNGPLSNMASPPNLFWETTSATTGIGTAYVYEPFTGTFHRSTPTTGNAFVLYTVPEPSVWATLGGGLGLTLAGGARRRR